MLKPGYGLDDDGFIVSDVSIDKIDSIYLPCIQESVNSLKNLFPLQLHSVYIYGSVPRGDAKPIHSDLDLIALFSKKLSSDEVDRLKTLTSELTNKYINLVRDIGIAMADYDYTIDPSNYYENAFLREISVCVYGEDLGERFGPYKLTSEIPIKFNGDICKSLHRTLNRLDIPSDEAFRTYTQGFARKLIRTYYSMVMVRSQIWSTRLHEQAEVFIHYFPDKESIVHTLLNWIDHPPTNRKTVQKLFEREGNWACANFAYEATMSSLNINDDI